MAWTFSVLVVANVTATSDELVAALRERAERDRCQFTLVVPVPGVGPAGHAAAERTLADALERLRAEGLQVQGAIGDHDPVGAIDDVWDPTRFDEVVISTLPTGLSKWLQVDLPHRAERATGVQVTHVVSQPPPQAPRAEPVRRPEHNDGILSPLTALTGKRPERQAR
jgi:hypothetical protein